MLQKKETGTRFWNTCQGQGRWRLCLNKGNLGIQRDPQKILIYAGAKTFGWLLISFKRNPKSLKENLEKGN